MKNPLILKISVANPPQSADVGEVYRAIENGLEDASCYRLDPGKMSAAAIEFVVILTSAAAIVKIADFLYNIWKDHRDKGQLYAAVDPEKNAQIMISNKTTEMEIESFQRKIYKIHESGQLTQMDQEILEEIKHTKIWIRSK